MSETYLEQVYSIWPMAIPKEGAKFDRCVDKVKKAGTADNPYAVCMTAVGAEEADSATAMPQLVRDQKKESLFLKTNFKEAQKQNDSGTRYRVALIKEGMGNLKDAFYYPASCLEESASIFEGKKMYADHPDAISEKSLPERSVKDIIGHFENVKFERDDQGVGMITADAVLLPDETNEWARTRFKHALDYSKKYSDKDFVGLSINAQGDAESKPIEEILEAQLPKEISDKLEKAIQDGINEVRIVSKIVEAVSVDLVTEAGAGGKILSLIESERKKKMEKHEAEAKMKHADGEHEDIEQDKELIKKMISQHLGDKEAESEAVMKQAHEVYQALKHAGLKHSEACESAAHAMKAAKAMHAFKHSEKKKESEAEAEGKKKEAGVFTDKGLEWHGESESEAEAEVKKHKESNLVAKLSGEVAALRESLRARSMGEYIDKKLEATGLPRRVTKLIKESVAGVKTEKEVDAKINLFLEGYKVGGQSNSLYIGVEKNLGTGTGSVSFADCIE